MMRKFRRHLSIVLVIGMVLGMFSTTFATPSGWAEDFLKSMLLEDMISDTFIDTNKFQSAITREEFAELVVMMYAKSKKVDIESINEWNPFVDSDSPMVAKAYNLNIVSGTGRDANDRLLYSPKRNVTRQEMAVMLVKMLKQLEINTTPQSSLSFSDKDQVASWALDAVRFVTETGILSGVGSNQIGPRANATREQSLVMMNKLGVRYNWIRNDLKKARFSSANSKSVLGFSLPNYDASQLRSISTSKSVTFIISFLVSDPVVDIKMQQKDLINILVNSDKITYDGLATLVPYINGAYDFSSTSFKEGSVVYVNPRTGHTSVSQLSAPYIRISYDGEFKMTYQE